MWYKLLVENEYAEHLITEDAPENNTDEQEKIALQMLDKYADIVYGITMAWTFCQDSAETVPSAKGGMPKHMLNAYETCLDRIPKSQAKSLSEIWDTIPREANRPDTYFSALTAEQCAVSLMYPFWSRMGGSFEQEFRKSGNLKKHLISLKNKCSSPITSTKQ